MLIVSILGNAIKFEVDVDQLPYVHQKLVHLDANQVQHKYHVQELTTSDIMTSIIFSESCTCPYEIRRGVSVIEYFQTDCKCTLIVIVFHCPLFEIIVVGGPAMLAEMSACKGYTKHAAWLHGHIRSMKDGT